MATGVVFIHGMWSQRGVWDRWLTPFERAGYVCDAVSLPGHHTGVRDEELARVDFDQCLDAVARAAARFAHPILIGHSMGGLIAQALAMRLTPRAVVLINSAAPRSVFPLRRANVRGLARHFLHWGLWRDVLRLSAREADYLLFGELPASERAEAQAGLVATSGRIAYDVGLGRFGFSHAHDIDPRALRCPMLALAGQRDRMIPLRVSRAMASHYGAALEYREYDAGHWLLGEAGYQDRIDEVLRWLAEHAPHASASAGVAP